VALVLRRQLRRIPTATKPKRLATSGKTTERFAPVRVESVSKVLTPLSGESRSRPASTATDGQPRPVVGDLFVFVELEDVVAG